MDFRPIAWVNAAKKEFQKFPKGAQERILRALDLAAAGRIAGIAKPMKGLGGGIYEIALRYRTDAYRAVYGVDLGAAVWVLHAFQKKSKTGTKTPRAEIDVIRVRIKRIKEVLR
jgi:phage-related protein